MQDSIEYKVIGRKKFAVIMVIVTSIVAVGVWVGLDHLAAYREHLEKLTAVEPEKAGAILTQLLRTFAVLNGLVLTGLAALIIWHGWCGWNTASMPPKGSWILEGQRTWIGEPAVRIAKFTIVVGVMLLVIGVASSLILWSMSGAFVV